MTEREQRAPAESRPRRVAGTIVLPRMHVREIFAPVCLDGHHIPDRTRCNPGSHLLEPRVEPELKPDERGEAPRFNRVLEFVDACEIVRQRLFNQQMRTSTRGR